MRIDAPIAQRRRSLSTTVVVAFIAFAMLGTSSVVIVGPTGRESAPAKTLALTAHAPIFIEGNGNFTSANGVACGTGTSSDPYVIKGWDIYMPDLYVVCGGISINNSDAYFIVRNCYVHGPPGSYGTRFILFWDVGIWLENCTNGMLVDNICSDRLIGILIRGSNNTVSSNNCSGNGEGIVIDGTWLSGVRNNTVSGNYCSDSQLGGISLYSHSNNTLTGNTCTRNDVGIRLWDSSGNTISWNLLWDNTGHGIGIEDGAEEESSTNLLYQNVFIGNNGAGSKYDSSHVQAYDNGTDNSWNSTDYGNYWSDWTAPDVLPPFGIVDLPYNLSRSATAKDYFPLTTTTVQTQVLLREISELQSEMTLVNEQLLLLENETESLSAELNDTRDDLDSANSAVEASNQKIDDLELMQTVLLAIVVLLLIVLAVMYAMMMRLKKVKAPPYG